MSLLDTLNKGLPIRKVNIADIRVNEMNDYDIIDDKVKAIASSIEKYGQMEPGIVYEESGNDGKKYTLISGEQRYRAISLLVDLGRHEGDMIVTVDVKPENKYEEQNKINDANIQRKKDHKTLYKEIKQKDEYYQHLIVIGQRPELHRRDYIANELGISSRSVANIINEFEGEKKKGRAKPSSGRQEYNKQFEKNLAKKHGFLTAVSQKSITFKFTDTDELNEFLTNCIGIEEKYNFEDDTNKE